MIKYQTANDGLVKLAVYDMLGREVKTLVNNFQPAGTYDIVLDASELTSGVYFYRLTSGSFEEMRKMIVVK
ncbi:MAG: T9SS type A sorting domain-containing protein [Ignavibacteria bacterium]|nr:T9SS type A sorting domain-containing protein [Ignavibacteria bacterium]